MPRTRKVTPVVTPAPIAAAPALDITIDLSGLTFGDVKLFTAMKNGTVDQDAIIEMLGRCVVGGIDHLPFTALPQIAQALAAAMSAASNPKN